MSSSTLIQMTPNGGVHSCTRDGRVQQLSLSVCSHSTPTCWGSAFLRSKTCLQRKPEGRTISANLASIHPLRSSKQLSRHFMHHEEKNALRCRGIYVGCRSGLHVAGQRKMCTVGSHSCDWKVGNHGWKVGRPLAPQPGGHCSLPKVANGARASSDYVRVSSTLQTDIPFPELNGVSYSEPKSLGTTFDVSTPWAAFVHRQKKGVARGGKTRNAYLPLLAIIPSVSLYAGQVGWLQHCCHSYSRRFVKFLHLLLFCHPSAIH